MTTPHDLSPRPSTTGPDAAYLASNGVLLRWILGRSRGPIICCALVTACWLGSQQLAPFAIGSALEQGLIAEDSGRLAAWTGVLAGIIVVQSLSGIFSHRLAVRCRLAATFLTYRAVLHHIGRVGATLSRRTATGEVISIISSDAARIAQLAETIGLVSGALVSFVAVVVLLSFTAPSLALVVLIGMPATLCLLRPVFTAMQERQSRRRTRITALNTLATDTVVGLRVLRGIGGEDGFVERYRGESRRVLAAGVEVSRTRAVIGAARVLLPGLLLVGLVWLGARMAMSGAVSAGELVAIFGYLMFLTRPLQLAIVAIDTFAHAHVAVDRLRAFLSLRPPASGSRPPAARPSWPARPGRLEDPLTGIRIAPGRLTAVVADDPARIEGLLDRLARYADPPGSYAGVRLDRYPLSDVRRRIHLLPQDAHLFAGELRDQLDVDGRRTDDEIVTALHTASALDIVGMDPALEELDPPPGPFRLTGRVAERGRQFSGGQRQRLVLARALLTEAETLLLDDPTSAVDSRTEERIAARLARYRAGRTTVVTTTSPWFLDEADEVVFYGPVVSRGSHRDLLCDPDYRAAVRR